MNFFQRLIQHITTPPHKKKLSPLEHYFKLPHVPLNYRVGKEEGERNVGGLGNRASIVQPPGEPPVFAKHLGGTNQDVDLRRGRILSLYKLGQIMGMDHPDTNGQDEVVYQRLLPHHLPLFNRVNIDSPAELKTFLNRLNPNNLLKINLFNYMFNVGDRHTGQYLIGENPDILDIDHDLAFAPMSDLEHRAWRKNGDPLVNYWLNNSKNWNKPIDYKLISAAHNAANNAGLSLDDYLPRYKNVFLDVVHDRQDRLKQLPKTGGTLGDLADIIVPKQYSRRQVTETQQ
jgi:hypothetical protein